MTHLCIHFVCVLDITVEESHDRVPVSESLRKSNFSVSSRSGLACGHRYQNGQSDLLLQSMTLLL